MEETIPTSSSSQNNRRIAKNTLMLYFRMILNMLVSLYTSRIVLNVLGVEDFGIYNVVGGVVVMLGFINSAMSASTQRFLSFELGKQNFNQLKKVFSTSVNIHFIVAFFVLIASETLGLWFLNTQMNISAERMNAANWVYQLSVLTFVINIITIPYQASIISHEAMNIYSILSILETLFKLLIVVALLWIEFDKLKLFAILTATISFFIRFCYKIYCDKKYAECHYHKVWDKDLIKQMGSFANWNLLGAFAGVTYNQGVNILINVFFGVSINAARAIAFQVQNAINSFVVNFQLAVNPALTKSYAREDKHYMYSLIFRGTKFSFYLLLCLAAPVILETEYILILWLKIVPEFAVLFTQLILIDSLIGSLSGFIQTMVQASGKIKIYQIIVSGILLLNLPISYLLIKQGLPPQYTFYVSISLSILALIARLFIVKKNEKFPLRTYLTKVIFPIIIVLLVVYSFSFCIKMFNFNNLLNIFLLVLFIIISTFILGIDKNEREFLLNKITKITSFVNKS